MPILLADAVYSPSSAPESGGSTTEYKIGSDLADLIITLPTELALNRQRLDMVFDTLSEGIESHASFEEVYSRLISHGYVSEFESPTWEEPIRATYHQVLNLHKRNWNGIWLRIARNYFWSASAGEFDLIIGNPPWVRWSGLPELYRQRVKPTCESYNIFSSTPHHGGNELDISAIITYTVADKWLKEGGVLAFVITQSVFQSPSSEGFRRFRIGEHNNLVVSSVDDMKSLKPFPQAANKTAIVLMTKNANAETIYPVDYRIWEHDPKFTRTIPSDLKIDEVLQRLEPKHYEANPVGGVGSPWAILPKNRFADMVKLTTGEKWINGRKGVTSDLNAIYHVDVLQTSQQNDMVQIQTRPEAGRTRVGPKRRFWVETDMIYPLIKGASDFSTCHFNPQHDLVTLVPNGGITKQHYDEAEIRIGGLPETRNYFRTYATQLSNRSTYRGRMPNAPFYAVYNVGSYTFAPFKVIWAEQSGEFEAAVASIKSIPGQGIRPFVPDHKVFFVPVWEENLAYFICGLLTSRLVKDFVESHNISIQVGNIFKHLALPFYEPSNEIHLNLVNQVKASHREPDSQKRLSIIESVRQLGEEIILETHLKSTDNLLSEIESP